jgi:hypothetical protein
MVGTEPLDDVESLRTVAVGGQNVVLRFDQ